MSDDDDDDDDNGAVPGPLVPPDNSLPRRNITARSYS